MSTQENNKLDNQFNTIVNSSNEYEVNIFNNLFSILKARRKIFFIVSGFVFLSSSFYNIHQRKFNPVYEGSFTFLINDPFRDEEGRSSFGEAGGAVFEQLARNTTTNDIPTLIEYLKSPLLIKPLAEKYNMDLYQLIENISIYTVGLRRKEAKGILNVNLYTKNYKKDEPLLKDLSELYLNAALQQKQKKLSDGLDFLNKQAPQLENKTAQLHGQLSAFREENNLLEPSQEGVSLKQRQEIISAALMKLNSQQMRLKKIRKEIKKGRLSARGFQDAVGDVFLDGEYNLSGLSITDSNKSFLQEQINLETELALSRSIYTPDSKRINGLENRLRITKEINRKYQLDAVDSAIELNIARIDDALTQKNDLTEEFVKKPALIEEYETLQQRLLIAQENLEALVKTRETFQLEMAQNAVPWSLISGPSMNPFPIKPSFKKNIFAGLLFGFFLGGFMAYIRDKYDNAFKSSDEVKNTLKTPILGIIPFVQIFENLRQEKKSILEQLDLKIDNKDPNLKEQRYQRFFYQEAFRNLITSIKFLSTDDEIKTILMTSSVAAEGKSLINTILAKTFADSGQKVLLIDADLRKPQLHNRLGVNNLRGLSNLLTDKKLNWEDVIINLPNNKNFNIIPAGITPPDPTKILNSLRMKELINNLKKSNQFDIIIFDTPPILGLADAALLSNYVDGVILLVSLNSVNKDLPIKSYQRVLECNGQLLGCIVNSTKKTTLRANGNGKYGYSEEAYSVYANYLDEGYESQENEEEANKEEKNQTLSNIDKLLEFNYKVIILIKDKLGKFLTWLDN